MSLQPIPRETLLETALELTGGDRKENYGDAKGNHERIAALWSVILGQDVTYQQVIQCMVAVKLARICETPDHRDSWVDVAGYAQVWDKAQHGE